MHFVSTFRSIKLCEATVRKQKTTFLFHLRYLLRVRWVENFPMEILPQTCTGNLSCCPNFRNRYPLAGWQRSYNGTRTEADFLL